jgi:hypothetical protein
MVLVALTGRGGYAADDGILGCNKALPGDSATILPSLIFVKKLLVGCVARHGSDQKSFLQNRGGP